MLHNNGIWNAHHDFYTATLEPPSNAHSILQYMKDEKFEINTHWILFSRLIGFPLDKIEPLDKRSALDGNYEINLESLLDDWLKNDPNCSWDTVNEHMEYLKYNRKVLKCILFIMHVFCQLWYPKNHSRMLVITWDVL